MNKEFSYNYGDYYHKDKFVRMRFDASINLLKPYIKNRVKVLDIGCYDGSMLEALRAVSNTIDIDYTGIDGDLEALDKASKLGVKVKQVNFETADFAFDKECFDVVIMAEVLEHLRDPSKMMQKAKELLKPNGIALISLPNECTIYHRIKVLAGGGIDGTGFEPGYHLHFPTIKQNRKFVSSYFKIIRTEYWYHLGIGGLAERMANFIPEKLIKLSVRSIPSLLARGVIYLCQK
jgi:methionine biosynthesis protein MetW